MAYYGSVKISDREGWVKTYPLEKALVMVGSGSMNDIALPGERGSGVATLHIQIIQPQAEPGAVRVVNLAKEGVPFRRSSGVENGSIPPGSAISLHNGDALSLGEYSLQFTLQSQAGVVRTARSAHLGLKLELPGLSLPAGGRLAGQLTVTNYGDQRRCQFELELEGLPAGCYQIDPAPLLYPGAEERLQVRIFHRGSRPPAGPQPFTLRATAPAAYPAETVSIAATLDVSPVYCFELGVQDPSAGVEPAVPHLAAPEAKRLEPAQAEVQAVQEVTAASLLPDAAPDAPPDLDSEAPPIVESDWFPAEGTPQPRATAPSRLSGGRRPVLRAGQPIPVIKAGPETGPEGNPPAGEGKTP